MHDELMNHVLNPHLDNSLVNVQHIDDENHVDIFDNVYPIEERKQTIEKEFSIIDKLV